MYLFQVCSIAISSAIIDGSLITEIDIPALSLHLLAMTNYTKHTI